MSKLSNVIFYNESWGAHHVLKKEFESDKVPNTGEIVVLQLDDDDDSFYKVEERVFDYVDDIVHLRLSKSPRCYDLTIM